jgi:uncharacterized protein
VLLLGLVAALFAGTSHCDAGQPTASRAGLPTVPVRIAGETFELEVAADPLTQYRGLGGRDRIDRDGGMLFVYPSPRPLAFVMRDCRVPIDVAFLDARGGVISTHEMRPEAPRSEDESLAAYEKRLHQYPSGLPAQFVIETAGGRLRELGLRGGDRIDLDADILARAHGAPP